jgi:hypothetical protein
VLRPQLPPCGRDRADDRVVARYLGGMPRVDVWDVYASLSGRDPSTLNDEQRRLIAVCVLRQELNSGGFDSYFRYRGGNSAPGRGEGAPDSSRPGLGRSTHRSDGPPWPGVPD